MFTGLIEGVCTVRSVRQSTASVQLAVDLSPLAKEAKIGDSIAVNGVCLTIARLEGNVATFDLSSETLSRSTLGKLRPSCPVNIERALRPTDRLGGHIVQGHVDGTGIIKTIEKRGQYVDINFAADPELLDDMVVKGSVAVDGISLTIANVNHDCFGAAIIPETLQRTTLGRAKVGDPVNIETDVIAKIIKKQLAKVMPKGRELTAEKLKQLGF